MSDPSNIPPVPPSASAPEANQTPELNLDAQPRQPPSLLSGLHALWTLLVRAVVLGAGISIGWLAGVLVAQFWPSPNPEPPLQERLMRRSEATLNKIRQLPQWWQGTEAEIALPSANPASPDAASPAPPPDRPPLSEAEQQQLTAELTTLQQDFNSLETRLTQLEAQVGQPATGSLESRLQQLEGAASPASPAPAAAPAPSISDNLGSNAPAPYQEPVFPVVSDRIVLPSALLFEPEGSLLTPSGQQLLDSIVPDLRRYGPVTLLVGSHTDGAMNAEAARQLTFQQALAVQQHLEPQLADVGLRWVTLGYGKTRPVVVGDAPGNQQRNQRLEIGIVQR